MIRGGVGWGGGHSPTVPPNLISTHFHSQLMNRSNPDSFEQFRQQMDLELRLGLSVYLKGCSESLQKDMFHIYNEQKQKEAREKSFIIRMKE